MPRKPRNQSLPQLEDKAIQEIEDAAESYADLRDDRIRMLAKEVGAQTALLDVMEKHKRLVYKRNGITARVKTGKNKVQVEIDKPEDELEGEDAEFEGEQA